MTEADHRGSEDTREDGASDTSVAFSTRIERLIKYYLTEPPLWPIVIAIAGHMAVVLAPLMLGLVRNGSPGGAIGLVALGMPSVGLLRMGWRINCRLGVVLLVGGTWSSAASLAWLADYYKFY